MLERSEVRDLVTGLRRPPVGATARFYPPATFPACSEHPHAGAVSVMVVEQQGRATQARIDAPVCPECGVSLISGLVE